MLVLPLCNLVEKARQAVRLVLASCSKPVAGSDIIAAADVTKTLIAADCVCQVLKDACAKCWSCRMAAVLFGADAGFTWKPRPVFFFFFWASRYAQRLEPFRTRDSSVGVVTAYGLTVGFPAGAGVLCASIVVCCHCSHCIDLCERTRLLRVSSTVIHYQCFFCELINKSLFRLWLSQFQPVSYPI
jgi:hypothetical protein